MSEISLKPLSEDEEATLSLSAVLDLSDCDFCGEHPLKGEQRASGVLSCVNGEILLEVELKLHYCGSCDRCARRLDRQYDIRLKHILSADERACREKPDLLFVPGLSLDFEAVAKEDILLNLPTKLLCSEECKGLCPRCGADLNEGPCGCAKEKDPRFSALFALLED